MDLDQNYSEFRWAIVHETLWRVAGSWAKNRNMFGIPKSRILKNVLLPLFKSVVGNFFYLGYLISLLQSLNLATLLFSWWELYIYRSTFLVASNYRSGSVFCTYNVELFILFFFVISRNGKRKIAHAIPQFISVPHFNSSKENVRKTRVENAIVFPF